MKKGFLSLFLFTTGFLLFAPKTFAVDHSRILFVHQDVGRRIYAYDYSNLDQLFDYNNSVDSFCGDGECSGECRSGRDCNALPNWFGQFNQEQGQNFTIKEVWWPAGHKNSPQIYDDAFNGMCTTALQTAGSAWQELEDACSIYAFHNFDVVIFKHSFGSSGIKNEEELEEYKSAYKGMYTHLRVHGEQVFIIWTLFPSTQGTEYDRQFVNWLKNRFTTYPRLDHLYIWDAFEYFTCDENGNGQVNSIYPGYHDGSNYPNKSAAQIAVNGGVNPCGEEVIGLGQFIVNAVYQEEDLPLLTPGQLGIKTILSYYSTSHSPADVNNDGLVNSLDFAARVK